MHVVLMTGLRVRRGQRETDKLSPPSPKMESTSSFFSPVISPVHMPSPPAPIMAVLITKNYVNSSCE